MVEIDSFEQHYSRQCRVLGARADARVHALRVLVVGVGGTGSFAVLQLAQLGVKKLRLVDRDAVVLSNLNRQALFGENSVGKPKAKEAAKILQKINSKIKYEGVVGEFNEKTAPALLRGIDAVLDCSDNYGTRIAINRACLKVRIPWIFCSALGLSAMVSSIQPKKSACFECWAKKPACEVSCAEAGILAPTAAVAASLAVQELVNGLALNKFSLTNKVLNADLMAMRFSVVVVSRRRGCVCGKN